MTRLATVAAHYAASKGHAEVVRLLAELGANITTPFNGWTPLAVSAQNAHFEASRTLLLLGAPITVRDLRQLTSARGNTRQLRADLEAWAADALTQHRTFHDTFLFGCSAHPSMSITEQTTEIVPERQTTTFATDDTGAKRTIVKTFPSTIITISDT